MKRVKSEINFLISNNLDVSQQVNILGNPSNLLDTANAVTEYKWDLTSLFPIPSGVASVEYRAVTQSIFSVFTFDISPGIDSLLLGLNSLGIGWFFDVMSGSKKFVETYNDDYVFGAITINSIPTSPGVTVNTVPAVSVKVQDGLGGVTYSAFKKSLGSYVYSVYKLFLQSSAFSQINGAFLYSSFDSNGSKEYLNIKPNVDPYQAIPSIYVDLTKTNIPVILNGNNNVSFTLQPNTSLNFKIFTYVVTTALGNYGANFLWMKRQAGVPGFFDEFSNVID